MSLKWHLLNIKQAVKGDICMTAKRLYHSIMLALQRTGFRRGNYLRKHNIFRHIGNNVSVQSRKIPLYPELISIHDNVHIASNVTFITHDISHRMLNANQNIGKEKFQETVGCIEILDNVFIGAGATVLYNVRIGSNVIVAAGSVITKDVPDNSVVGGVPARVLEPLHEYLQKLKDKERYPTELCPKGQVISKELSDYLWKCFERERS